MPHIRVRALPLEQVQSLSQSLAKELAPLMETSEDNFTLEKVETQFFQAGKKVSGDPYIEVLWFERGAEIQKKSAAKITELVKKLGDYPYVSVVFTALPKTAYFENSEHF